MELKLLKGKERRCLVMCLGILIMGVGISLFKISFMGNDPSTAMMIAIGDLIGIDFAIVLLAANTLFFLVEIIFGRKYIGIGTFVNWFGVGTLASSFTKLITAYFTIPEGFLPRMFIMIAGVLVLSLSASMYQTADLGIAPYDCLSIILDEKLPIPYFWCRIFTDGVCALVAYGLGGIVGLGTLICALGLGPFIQFFSKNVSEKLCGYAKAE